MEPGWGGWGGWASAPPPACPAVDHPGHGEPLIARIWCMCLAYLVNVALIVPLLILSRCEQGREAH